MILDAPDRLEEVSSAKHDKYTYFYAIAKMCERASYYGFKAILVLYLIDGFLKMERGDALSLYGFYFGGYIFLQFLGALLGDLVLGNRRAIIIGGVMQAAGAFCLCISNMYSLYLGLFLVAFGSAFFTPNIQANFGKSYLNKIKLLDAGYSIFYLAINVGSFIGISSIAYVGEVYGWNSGFILAGLFSILSLIAIFSLEEEIPERVEVDNLSVNSILKKILFVILFSVIFWVLYEMFGGHIPELEVKLYEVTTWDVPRSYWTFINSGFAYLIAIVTSILWTYYYSSPFFKLTLGFVFTSIGIGALLFIPDAIQGQYVIIYFIAMFFLAIGEMYIYPVVYSVVTQYTNPKYLAIVSTGANITARILSNTIAGFAIFRLYDQPRLLLWIVLIIAIVVSAGLVLYVLSNKKDTV